MSNSKGLSKFLLKPSSLSQHTVNFNKILEEKPTPKVENFTIKLTHEDVKPIAATEFSATTPTNATNNENQPTETPAITTTTTTNATMEQPPKPEEKEKEQPKPTKEFVFGEKLHDRVTITEAATFSNGSSNGDKTAAAEGETDKNTTPTKTLTSAASSDSLAASATGTTVAAAAASAVPVTVFSTDDSTTHNSSLNNLDYTNEIESNDSATLLKLNGKLYILEANKINWIERGYGILKVIETNDKSNVKLMMWTDKIFRLILNTKLFENMIIDKANNKSIRFNGYDNGTVRVFLIKTANANDCDELYHLLTMRAHLLATMAKKQKSDEAINKENTDNTEDDKHVLLKCECSLKKGLDDCESRICQLKVSKEMTGRWSQKNKAVINVRDEDDSINITSDLTHIKLAQKSKDTNYSFIINTPSDQNYYILVSDNQKLKKLLEIYDDILSSAYDEDDDYDVSNSDNNDSNLSPSSNGGEKGATKRAINRSQEKSEDSSQSSDNDDHATKKPKLLNEDS